jgi:serine/threonine protein kinase
MGNEDSRHPPDAATWAATGSSNGTLALDLDPGGTPESLAGEDRYHRIECLGRGGMGEVWRAWDRMLRRHVALKSIRADRLTNASLRERFLAEAQATA